MPTPDRIHQAIELLALELRERVAAHPAGHLLLGREGAIDLRLRLPVIPRNGDLRRASEAAAAALSSALHSVLTARALFRPGRAVCLRCGSADCAHTAPASEREVFAGYGPTGLPRFQDLPQLLLARGEERIDQLYTERPQLIAHVQSGAELTADLLPVYRDRTTGYRLHGQVVAGWFRGLGPDGIASTVAVTLQIASLPQAKGRRAYGLNVIGKGPGGESLEAFCSRLDTIPWLEPVRWAQSILEQLSRGAKQQAESEERRIAGILRGLAARFDKGQRAAGRRTHHGEERHRQGTRPTRMAQRDLARARPEGLFIDTRYDTLVVLGEKGRAHVFNRDGKLVTSLRHTPDSIARRQKQGIWRQAREEEVAGLKERVVRETSPAPPPH